MSFTNCIYHIVFATASRRKTITIDKEREVYGLLYHILVKYGCHVYRIGGMPDHIHILVAIPASTSVSSIVQKLKRESSYVISEDKILPLWDGWQEGYGGFTCSIAEIDRIMQYIKGQKQHHTRRSFVEEYRAWLVENGVSEDNPYLPKSDI